MCASAPALKLFFERFLKVASMQGSTLGQSQGSKFEESKMLRDPEGGSFALVSQRSETQSGSTYTSTYARARTIAEEIDGPLYAEKMEIEEWEGQVNGRQCGIATPCPAHFRSEQWRHKNRTVYNLSSCSWYDE